MRPSSRKPVRAGPDGRECLESRASILESAGLEGGVGHSSSARIKNRFRVALCRQRNATQRRETQDKETGHREQGSAVVEFTFLALLLMVPLVYFIITVGQIQGGSFAVVGAADQAAKVFVAQPDAESGRAAAEQAALIALADFGHEAGAAQVSTRCDPADCHAAGTAVTVTVNLTVPLPFIPFNDDFRLQASEVQASSTQLVGRFR
jgi:Flp pilus assembly protein TadG